MNNPRSEKVKIITSVIYKDEDLLNAAEKKLIDLYGELDGQVLARSFDYTDYYGRELGSPLKRKIFSFKKLAVLEDIQFIKLKTNEIEAKLSLDGKRRVNIDPGYVTAAKLVLFSTKDYSHRIYIGKSLFAEITLVFTKGAFRPCTWTYPDYASKELIEYFNNVRGVFMSSVNHGI